MPKKPNIHKTQIIAESKLFSIEELHLEFSNGNRRIYERLKPKNRGAVLIVPMLDDETILLVREYAAGVDRYEIGFPKGLIDPGEDIFQAANRELMEEVGYGANKFAQLKTMTSAPGYSKNIAETLLARDLYPAKLQGDEPEELEVIPWLLKDYRNLLAQEDFTESRSIAALLLVKEMFG